MIKRRHVVILSTNIDLMVVAPFSTKTPRPQRACHHRIPAGAYPFFDAATDSWLKGDMLMAASRDRLDRVRYDGAFQRAKVNAADLKAIRTAVLNGLGLSALTAHL